MCVLYVCVMCVWCVACVCFNICAVVLLRDLAQVLSVCVLRVPAYVRVVFLLFCIACAYCVLQESNSALCFRSLRFEQGLARVQASSAGLPRSTEGMCLQ